MGPLQRERFEKYCEVDLGYGIPKLGRFRVNIYQQRGTISIALRVVPQDIKTFSELNLPPILKEISQESRGFILVTGITGSGKSTTLAAMIDYINSIRASNIITIEDPIEYLHRDKKSIIAQREVDVDTTSFARALRVALRQDPDVILVGEMRDLETTEIALHAAETGHLVLSTLHTLDARETINRILAIFPPHQHNQVRYQLAQVLKAIISQRLVPTVDGKGRVPAVEILLATERIRELITDPARTKEIKTAIEEGQLHYGMQSFDQSLFELYSKGLISYEETMNQATAKADLALRIKGITSGTDAKWGEFQKKMKEGSLPKN